MNLKNKILQIIRSDWTVSLILLAIFFLTTSYKYGWDDQHLEIPLLKHLIDPGLYVGDYYVESLKQNFSSFFYPILAKLITVDQIPTVYFYLYILSRYFLFFFSYKIWRVITQNRYQAFMCVTAFLLVIRVDEFLYRTFSHQEFALAIIFAGIYFFFKERFILAGALLGLAANLHALYSLFPMLFIGLYLLWQIRKHGIRPLFLSSLSFIILALPFVFWTIQNRYSHIQITSEPPFKEWVELYKLACPQNFFLPIEAPFKELIKRPTILFGLTKNYWLLISMFGLNLLFNPILRRSKKALTFCLGAFGLLILCFLFTYIYPNRFFLDLNIIRNTQFLLFFLLGFTVILFMNTIKTHHALIGFLFGTFLIGLKFETTIAIYTLCSVGLLLTGLTIIKKKEGGLSKSFAATLWLSSTLFLYLAITKFLSIPYKPYIKIYILITIGALFINLFLCLITKKDKYLKPLFIIIPMVLFFTQFYQYRIRQTNMENAGKVYFWKLQKDWEATQMFVKNNTEKDAIIFVPHNMEMGGFRIGSERELVVSYRDCGIIGFDYSAAKEWDKRIADVQEFNIRPQSNPGRAIKNAIVKYEADYIVFLRQIAPKKNISGLTNIFQNESFVLYKIHRE